MTTAWRPFSLSDSTVTTKSFSLIFYQLRGFQIVRIVSEMRSPNFPQRDRLIFLFVCEWLTGKVWCSHPNRNYIVKKIDYGSIFSKIWRSTSRFPFVYLRENICRIFIPRISTTSVGNYYKKWYYTRSETGMEISLVRYVSNIVLIILALSSFIHIVFRLQHKFGLFDW